MSSFDGERKPRLVKRLQEVVHEMGVLTVEAPDPKVQEAAATVRLLARELEVLLTT